MGINKDRALKMMLEGKTQVEIAEEFNVTQSAVSSMLMRLKKCPHCGKIITGSEK